jgi:hypothetical protein
MFCNKCGKTLNPEAKACPSCGQPVGDSRFEGSGYTSSQVRFVPEKAEREGYAPYTKTTYSSMPDEDGDVYSRTSYRPALSEDEGRQTTGFADAESEPGEQPEDEPVAEEAPEFQEPEEREAPATRNEPAPGGAPEDRDALGFEIRPLEPIRKTGISPEVQRYIQQMNQRKGRVQRKAQEGEAQEADGGHEPEQEYAQDHDAVYAPRAGVGKWALRIGGVLLVLVLLVAGVLFIVDRTATRAKIPGVTYTLYTEGIAGIKQHVTNEYRAEIIKLWRADQTGKAAATQQEGEGQAIAKLMPEKPLENDQRFVDTLMAIQESINAATATDAIAALGAGNTTLGSLTQESEKNWQLINGKIAELEAATDIQQLDTVRTGVNLATIPTPEPEATATPSPYKTLKKGMKNNKQVKNLQDRLYKLGWFNGVRDGDFGPATQTAVKKFQKALGLPEAEQDGIATSALQEQLYADNAPRGDGKAPSATTAPDATPAPEGGETPNT